MFALDFFNFSHDFLLPSCGIWTLKLVGRLVSTSTQQDNFLNLLCDCLYLQPPQIYSFSWRFLSQTNRTNKTFWGRYRWICKYNSKGDDHGAGRKRKMSYLVKAGYFLLKLVITNSLFSTGPPIVSCSQGMPSQRYCYQKIILVMKSIKMIWLLFFFSCTKIHVGMVF